MLSSGEWREREYELDVAEAIAGSLPDGMTGCLARVLAARGVTADALSEYLSPDLKSLPPPSSLPGVADCARVILDAVAQGRGDLRGSCLLALYGNETLCHTAQDLAGNDARVTTRAHKGTVRDSLGDVFHRGAVGQ